MTPIIIDWYTATVVAGGGARDRPSNERRMPEAENFRSKQVPHSQTDTDTSNKHTSEMEMRTRSRTDGPGSKVADGMFSIMVITCVTPSMLHVRRVHTAEAEQSLQAAAK